MPQLAKGGKWVFGWSVVDANRQFRIPPEAWAEYGFSVDDVVFFMRGSRRSGGFGVSTPSLWPAAFGPAATCPRFYGEGRFVAVMQVALPVNIPVQPDKHLLVVRGSGNALGFLTQGPIYAEALRHSEIEVFL